MIGRKQRSMEISFKNCLLARWLFGSLKKQGIQIHFIIIAVNQRLVTFRFSCLSGPTSCTFDLFFRHFSGF